MAKPTHADRPRLLALELWGLGDLALALPFLRAATAHASVTLVAAPHAAPLLRRFAPAVELIPFTAPWTAFTGKYRLHRWPWRELSRLVRTLRAAKFSHAIAARPDPRDHLLLRLSGAQVLLGFPRVGSRTLLTAVLPPPPRPHRAAHWQALVTHLGWSIAPGDTEAVAPLSGQIENRESKIKNHVVIHAGAAQPTRLWPRENYDVLTARLRAAGWHVTVIDHELPDLTALLDLLANADRFIGNDSGPGHLAALLGVPTFTIFGPQLPELFSPQHPQAAWIEGAPCPHKPCFDHCRFATPHCIRNLSVDAVHAQITAWLARG